ncbi:MULTISPECIES: LysR family transcriptional regulator [Acutalibacteraceae]|uniref:LysR family transcriptional regulator n=1 Tax=Acutalibacteraceae TaxID=3082771 RepID=UPI00196BA9CF|nr:MULTISPECIES: LysR family transcriptional regulator [Acutalibacteraceae]
MTIRHIRIFLAVCECGNNITKAAAKLYMTQPAVTVAVHEIESEYGVLLFDRISKRLYLTEAGKRFREYALRISALFDDMEKDLKGWDASGILRIGASITIGSQFMPSYVEAFSASHPHADVRVLIGPSNLLERDLIENRLDFALVETPVHEKALTAEAYMEDSLSVICPARAPFRPGQVLTIDEFQRQRFLLRERGSGTREVFDQAAAKAGIAVTPAWEGMSTTALVNAVLHGLGIAVVPSRMITGPLERGLIYTLTVKGLSLKRCFFIVHHKDKLMTELFREFIQLCKNYEMDYPLPRYGGLF